MPGRRPLFVHIGLQKTGTSYLQSIFWLNQDGLAEQGLDLVPATKRGTFHLMLRVRNRYVPGVDPPGVATSLETFVEELAGARGSRALLSQESLAGCTAEQVETLLSACADREVHVVLTVRDLGRQLPSSWQQTLQSGESMPYERYLRRLRRQTRTGALPARRLHLDPPAVLERWARHVPPERIHVVTVPPSGNDPGLLLQRYCRVLGVDPAALASQVASTNTGLGRVQSEVLRRVNAGLEPRLRRRQIYGDLGKRYFAVQVLGAQERQRTRVPQRFEAWCRQTCEAHIDALRTAGYAIEGDLADLRSGDAAFSAAERAPKEREVAASAVQALVLMLAQRAAGRRGSGSSARVEPTRSVGGLAARLRGRLSARGKSH